MNWAQSKKAVKTAFFGGVHHNLYKYLDHKVT